MRKNAIIDNVPCPQTYKIAVMKIGDFIAHHLVHGIEVDSTIDPDRERMKEPQP